MDQQSRCPSRKNLNFNIHKCLSTYPNSLGEIRGKQAKDSANLSKQITPKALTHPSGTCKLKKLYLKEDK